MARFVPDKPGSLTQNTGRFVPDKPSSPKKPAKKKGGGWLGNAVDVVVNDAKTLATEIPKEALKGGKAAITIANPYSSWEEKKKSGKTLAWQAAGVAQGVEEIIPNPKSLPYGDVSLVQIKDGKVRFWVPGGENDDFERAAKAWTTRPLTSTLTAFGTVAPLGGALSVGKIASSLRQANRTMSRNESLRLARRESRNPGFLAAQGIKGGLDPRVLKSEFEGGQPREVELPQARSAIGRSGQEAVDAVSKVLPKGAPLSERRRANRQIAREMDETDRRNAARAANLMDPVRKVAFGKNVRARRGNQSLLAYALQTPDVPGDPFNGPRMVADKYDSILETGKLTPDERKRITAERDRIRKALANPPDPGDFAAAVAAMERIAAKSTNVSRYITQGRAGGVSPARAAQLDRIFQSRKNLLSRYLGIEESVPAAATIPSGVLYHGSPEGIIGTIDPTYHTKTWKEGIGFYITESPEKAKLYAQGRTASKDRKAGGGGLNYVKLKPGTKVMDLDAPADMDFWRGIARDAGWKDADFDEYMASYAGKSPTNWRVRDELMDAFRDQFGHETSYLLEDALSIRGIQATTHIEGRNSTPHRVWVVKDASALERHGGNNLSDLEPTTVPGEARGFFPHRTRFDLRDSTVEPGGRGAGTVIGRPRGDVNMKKNELKLFGSAKVDTDPRVLERQYASNMRFLEAEQRRRELFDESVPLDALTGKEKGGYLIRDPDRAAAQLSKEQGAMHDPQSQARQLLDDGDEDGAFAAWRDEWLRPYSASDDWTNYPDSVRWVPRDVVDKRLPKRVSVDPSAKVRPLLGTLNALARVATIHGKPARYLASNTVQNLVVATITSPTVAVRGVMSQGALARAVPAVDKMWRALRLPDGLKARRPDLYRLAAAETGDVQATAGLPNIRAAANKTQKMEMLAAAGQHKLGGALGSVADTPFRVAMWMKHAKRLGFKSDAQLERLLTSDEPHIARARRQAMQSTRDDMYDFNRSSTWERDTISRFFFLWPLVRAGVRFPVTYARDYPVRAGAGAALTLDSETVDANARDLFKFPTSGGKEYDGAWMMPHGIAVEQMQNLQRVLSGDFYAVGGMLSPPLRDTGQALFGFPRTPRERGEKIVRSLVPGFSTAQDVYREGAEGLPVVKRFTPQKPYRP